MGRRVFLRGLVIVALLFGTLIFSVNPVSSQFGGSTPIVPSVNPLFFGSSGNVKIDVPKPGIAVRIEVPREFLQGVISAENDTSFIQSNIRNDYFYYNVVDESIHWTYAWRGNVSAGPCFKPTFSIRDPNAPWCVEIWNYLNGNWMTFTVPKFVQFRNLNSPQVAGLYNFTLFVADHTNILGYPDFVHAWNTTLYVPVSMTYNPATLRGVICDGNVTGCPPIRSKGVVYARNTNTGQMARAYVNQTLCGQSSNVNCGLFKLTGVAPGTYLLQASAGVANGVAYSLSTNPTTFTVGYGDDKSVGGIPLRRAPQVCGSITYENSLYPGASIRSFSGHPYLRAAWFGTLPPNVPVKFNLNITVEANDPWGHVYRFQRISSDTTSDSFTIATGNGTKYVGTDPYGTEFAGLPAPEDQGHYALTLRVWVSGYVQKYGEIANVNTSPGVASIPCTCSPSPNPVVMQTGSVISGTIQFWNLQTLETPDQAEASLGTGLPVSDALFGGNILIQAYNSSGTLTGVTVINGTLPNGKTSYANSNSIPFYIIGFTEYYNHSWSGSWGKRDYGLPGDSGYTFRVFIRGYEQAASTPIPLILGANQTLTVQMVRGGAFSVMVYSADNRPGTRAIQASMTWSFLNLRIPVSARVYFYGAGGLIIGYVELLMIAGNLNPNNPDSFQVIFAGQNWSLREIWFFGYIPTHISSDTYTMRAYTLGYVPMNVNGITAPNDLVGFGQVAIVLFKGNEADVTVPIFADPQTFATLPEYDHAIGQVFSGSLAGAVMANLSIGTPTLQFPIFGFGGMLLNDNTLLGQGHFFYVAPDGRRYFDYGLDVGNYTAGLPEFGFTVHFLQVLSLPVVQFRDLFLQSGTFLKVYTMARIVQGPLVSGWIVNPSLTFASLSWAQVQASNQSYSRAVSTFDGRFEGVGALYVAAGIYNITYSEVFYQSKSRLNFPIQWAGIYFLSPSEALCPIGGISGTCPVAAPPFFSVSWQNLLMVERRETSVITTCKMSIRF